MDPTALYHMALSSSRSYADLLLSMVKPNATHQARREAGAQRTLEAVGSRPWFGWGGQRQVSPPPSRRGFSLDCWRDVLVVAGKIFPVGLLFFRCQPPGVGTRGRSYLV